MRRVPYRIGHHADTRKNRFHHMSGYGGGYLEPEPRGRVTKLNPDYPNPMKRETLTENRHDLLKGIRFCSVV